MSRYMKQLACKYHPDAELIEDYRAGDIICRVCALVVGERMVDVGSEWRDFGSESNSVSMNRVGAAQNLLYDTDNLETMTIGTSTGPLNGSNQPKYNKNINQMSSEDKALKSGYEAIRIMAGRIVLTKRIINQACLIYKLCYEKKCLRGRSQDAIVATCIYVACRKEGSARSMKEIFDISTVSLKEINRCFNKIKAILPTSEAPQSIEIKDLVPRFCSRLNLNNKMHIQKTAIHIAQRADEVCSIQGRAPSSIAGAAIYLACLAAGEEQTKKDVQQATAASEGVIRDVYRIMLRNAAQLFPSNFDFKCPVSALPVS